MKAFFGQLVDGGRDVKWALKVEGLSSDFPSAPFGRQLEGFEVIKQFKATAKSEWISAKVRDGKRGTTEVKRWVKEVKPKEFCAKWLEGEANDDSIQIFYKQ